METKQEWKPSDLTNGKYLGVMEFHSKDNEWHYFEIIETEEKLIFGGCCNVGFSESGYILKDGLNTEEALSELWDDLQCYYNEGARYTSLIVFNERM